MITLREAAQQALEALETVFMPHHPAVIALKAALEQPEQTNPWRDAVDNELVSLHMVASDDPRESIRRLIDWHCAVQIDPLVSSAAQDLIERGKREALEPEQEPKSTWQKLYEAAIDQRNEAVALNQELLQALKDATDAIEHWGSYASDFFQQKWDLHNDINAARAAIARAEGQA
jgi:hypothetical protein